MDGTYTQEASTIAQGSHILIGDSPCQVNNVKYTDDEGSRDDYGCTFDAYDIFSWEKRTLECRATDLITCPYVLDSEYKIVWIKDEGLVYLRTLCGKKRTPLTLPTTLPAPRLSEGDDPSIDFVTHYQRKILAGKKFLLLVKSAMGMEHICGISELSQ